MSSAGKNTDTGNIVVRKPAATTHFLNQYSLGQRKLINICLANASQYDFNRDEYELSLAEVRPYLTTSQTKNYGWFKELSEGLVSTLIEWNTIGKDRADEWEQCTFLASARFRKGKYRYRINPMMVEKVKNPKIWGKIRLLAQVNMKKQHSLVIYEFLSTEFSLLQGKTQEFSIETPLADIRTVCGLTENQYRDFKDFNRYVLKPASKEISEYTEFMVTYEALRTGRAVGAIKFVVQRKQNFQYTLPGLQAPFPSKVLETPDGKKDVMRQLLAQNNVSASQIDRLIGKYSLERIERNVAYAIKQEKVKNLPAYIVKAIEEDFSPAPSATEIAEKEKAATEHKVLVEKLATERKTQVDRAALEKEFESFRSLRFWEKFSARSAEWQAEQKAEVEASFSGFERKFFQEGGWDGGIARGRLFLALKDEILSEPEEHDFAVFVASRA